MSTNKCYMTKELAEKLVEDLSGIKAHQYGMFIDACKEVVRLNKENEKLKEKYKNNGS